jgi:hypothetical protein
MADKIDAGTRESVARAISTRTFATIVGNTDCHKWEDMAESDRVTYRFAADAALAAMQSANPAFAEVSAMAAALRGIFEHYGDRRNSPGHGHTVTGVWDDDISNGTNAGLPCEWCATWNNARAILSCIDGTAP